MRAPLSRRTVLRGAGGAVMALPLLEAMLPRRAQAAPPRRFVVFYTPNGTNSHTRFTPQPQRTGPLGALPIETAPLEPLKSKLLVLSGIDGRQAVASAEMADEHANGMVHMLTAAPWYATYRGVGSEREVSSAWGGAPSIDQEIAKTAGQGTRFASLELGVQSVLGRGAHPFSRMVYKGSNQPVPAQDDPREVWKRLFSDSPPAAPGMPAPAVDQAREQRKSVLDFVRRQYEGLAPRLGAADRTRLDRHTTFIRDVEKRLATPVAAATPVSPGAGCQRPAEPGAALDPNDPKQFPDIGKLQMDLLAMALVCDLTRVASIQWSWARSDVYMSWINVAGSHHDLSHGDPSATLSSINTWYAKQLAYLGGAFDAVNELGSTLLDNTVIWWCSDVAEGSSHSFTNIRAFLLGSCGGFFKTGQQVAFNGAPDNQLMVTFLRAMGNTTATQFNDLTAPPGPLPGLG